MASQSLKTLVQRQAFMLVFFQLIGIAIIAILALLFKGLAIGIYVFLGGMSYGISNLIFVWLVFRFTGAHQMLQFFAAFFIGEMLKLVSSAFLALLIVKYLPHSLLSVLVGFIGAIVSFWVACVCLFARQPAKHQGVAG